MCYTCHGMPCDISMRKSASIAVKDNSVSCEISNVIPRLTHSIESNEEALRMRSRGLAVVLLVKSVWFYAYIKSLMNIFPRAHKSSYVYVIKIVKQKRDYE